MPEQHPARCGDLPITLDAGVPRAVPDAFRNFLKADTIDVVNLWTRATLEQLAAIAFSVWKGYGVGSGWESVWGGI